MGVKLLYISTERGWHGGEEQFRQLAEHARAAGHDVRIAARASGEFAQRMSAARFGVTELAGSVRGPRAAWRVRQIVRAFHPAVVHSNEPHGLSLVNLSLVGVGRHERGGPLRIAHRRVLFPVRAPGKYRRCDQVLCVSRAIAEVCRTSGLPSERLTVLHEGVDPARMCGGDAGRGREALGLSPDVPLVLCVAQLAEYKGHRYLLGAWPAVRAAHPHAVLVLAGDGPLRSALEAQVANLGLADAVRFLGYRTDVPDLIQACDLFVLASPEEGLGTSVLDAMFAKRAVIGADAGGIPEMLRDEAGDEHGWLVPARDPAALATAINVALADPAERARRAAAGRRRAEQEFTASIMATKTLALYERLLADAPRNTRTSQ